LQAGLHPMRILPKLFGLLLETEPPKSLQLCHTNVKPEPF
jgi:hypothetical protein